MADWPTGEATDLFEGGLQSCGGTLGEIAGYRDGFQQPQPLSMDEELARASLGDCFSGEAGGAFSLQAPLQAVKMVAIVFQGRASSYRQLWPSDMEDTGRIALVDALGVLEVDVLAVVSAGPFSEALR